MAIRDPHGLASAFLKEWEEKGMFIKAHTSGSTGTPKEIRLAKTDMMASAKATCEYFDIDDKSQLLLPLPVDYIAGKMMVVRGLVSGADLTILSPSNAALSCQDYPWMTDLVAIVPSQIPSLIEATAKHEFKNVIVGGAPMSPLQEQALKDSGINAFATYGMTESCSHVALRRISSNCYEALPEISFSTDERNCLIVHSRKMSFGTLYTNDVVKLLSDKSFQWLGRYDNTINSGGIKIHPEEDEELLAKVICDTTFYISSIHHEVWGETPVLVLEGEENGKTAEYLEQAAKLLPKYHAPQKAIWLNEFERTTSGKIKRNKF